MQRHKSLKRCKKDVFHPPYLKETSSRDPSAELRYIASHYVKASVVGLGLASELKVFLLPWVILGSSLGVHVTQVW